MRISINGILIIILICFGWQILLAGGFILLIVNIAGLIVGSRPNSKAELPSFYQVPASSPLATPMIPRPIKQGPVKPSSSSSTICDELYEKINPCYLAMQDNKAGLIELPKFYPNTSDKEFLPDIATLLSAIKMEPGFQLRIQQSMVSTITIEIVEVTVVNNRRIERVKDTDLIQVDTQYVTEIDVDNKFDHVSYRDIMILGRINTTNTSNYILDPNAYNQLIDSLMGYRYRRYTCNDLTSELDALESENKQKKLALKYD